ncbi:MAG: ferrous iron transport protein B [Ignavibacteriaceae bacterium]
MSTETIEKIPFITLIGPPNSGKTTLFNYLSGKNYKTVNYPGATVEYSISRILKKFNLEANLLDSPGIISLIPESLDEKISIDSIYNHPKFGIPDLVIITVDASQLSRHLLLVNQMEKAKFNILIALTMTDMLNKRGLDISIKDLENSLNCNVVKIDGRTGKGVEELLKTAEHNLQKTQIEGVEEPIYYEKSFNNSGLLEIYADIEKIEKKVLISFPSENNIDVKTANKRLVVLNENSYGIKNNNLDFTTLKIDKILLHKVWGLAAFFLIMAGIFTSIFWLASPIMNLIGDFFGFAAAQAFTLIGNNWVGDFVANGIITGAGSVLVFVPQILILFLILGLLEDTGYLARGAMLIDRPLSKIGLNGRSFVPMLSGFACAIPAMLAARTIPNRRERLLTIFIIPLMSCSARLPVYALLIGFLFPGDKSWIAGIVLASIYIFSTASSIIVAGILNKFNSKLFGENNNSSFILELPTYRKPKLSVVANNAYHSAKLYFKKAGPIILGFSMILWFLTYFPNSNPKVDVKGLNQDQVIQLQKAERLSSSYAADLGKGIQPLMRPLGLDWRVGVSLISAFTAREVFVSSLALIFKVTDNEATLQNSILDAMRNAKIEGTNKKLFTTSTIFGLIVFFVFALQCLSTIAVSKKETGSWKIPMLQLLVFTSMAYIFAFITVNGLRLIGVP